MSRQIELALVSMLPTYNKDLPPQLVDLAGSLLAQSRSKASTLKAEEEIARQYACANIACERLKIALDLPTIEPRPPIPPRIYKKLYQHLDNILPNAAGSSRRSSMRTRTSLPAPVEFSTAPNSEARPIPSRATPTKEKALAQFKTADGTPSKKPSTKKDDTETLRDGLHPWIAPAIRFMCSESDNKRIAPTVLAGAEIIACPGGRKTEDTWVNEHPTEMLVAIVHAVFIQLALLTSADSEEEDLYTPMRKTVMELLNRARSEAVFIGMEEDGAWDGWVKLKVRDFDEATSYAKAAGWFDSDWFRNIVDVVSSGNNGKDAVDVEDTEVAAAGPGRRADTMFQERYDYLSEARIIDYRVWKTTQLDRISQAIAAGGAGNAMDIDS